jgi:hypothetical protein
MPLEKIEEVKKIGKLAKADPGDMDVAQSQDGVAPNKEYFEALMNQEQQPGQRENPIAIQPAQTGPTKPSLVDEVRDLGRKADHVSRANLKDLVAQSQEVINQIDSIKQKLNTPNLEIKASVQTLLRNKLTHIDENIKIALSKAGVEYKGPDKVSMDKSPIERFLGYLTDGQYKLDHLSQEVQKIGNNKDSFAPADMLVLQMKMSYITQELELFTSVLNKALESIKTTMNVQV